MEKILVLDDLRYFGTTFEDKDLVYARNEQDAYDAVFCGGEAHKKLQSDEYYSEIWFDHDLGEDETTVKAARCLEELGYRHPYFYDIVKIRIISDNPAGRKELIGATRNFTHIQTIPRTLPLPENSR